MRITAPRLVICAMLWTACQPALAQDTTTLSNVTVKALVSAAAVPEPGTLALLATALLLSCLHVRSKSAGRASSMTAVRAAFRRWAAALVFASGTTGAQAIVIDLTHVLDANDFGVAAGVIDGVLERSAALWQLWLPSTPNRPADHPQNAKFQIIVGGSAILDDTGKNPANTLIAAEAKPTGQLPLLIEINTDKDAVDAMFWDPTPKTTIAAEFSVDLGLPAGKWKAVKGDLGFGKFDMLTVMLHELGHGLGFSRDYSDFSDWADNIWNPGHPENIIRTPAHFTDSNNLMSNAAGFPPDGKSGRSFIQLGDTVAFRESLGYMVPEPSVPALLAAALLAVLASRRRGGFA